MNFEKHYTSEQLEHLRAREFSAGDQQRISGLWDRLFLTSEFTQGDPGMQKSLASFYSDKENLAKARAAMPALPAAWEFIQKARQARAAR